MRFFGCMTSLLALGWCSSAIAGGPPPVYIIVEKVVMEPGVSTPGWVQIWGSMTRTQRTTDSRDQVAESFSRPSYGYFCLSLDSKEREKIMEELAEMRRAAGTGKAVPIGLCGEAGAFLKCRWNQPSDRNTPPDAVYVPGHLKTYGALFATRDLNQRPEVKALLQFAATRK